MSKLFLISRSYEPNYASNNRMMSWVRGLAEMGIKAEYVFFSPNDKYDKVQQVYPNIKFTYLWDKCYSKDIAFRNIKYFYNILSFILGLNREDKVYIYSFPEILKWVLKRPGVRVYDEITECPTVSLAGSRFYKPDVDRLIKDCKRLDGLIVISQNLKDYFVERGLCPEKVHVVNMTVDLTRFEYLVKQNVERYIVYCGSATNNKDGVDQLIRAFKIVTTTHKNIKLFIIGPKPSGNNVFENLNLARELGIEDRIVFTGSVSAADVPQLLKNATICALDRPNNIQAKYGFPTKLGEYLLTGNPVVITRVGNMPDFLQDGVSALIAEPDNIHSFAEKLIWCLEHPDDAKQISTRGAEVALKEFNYKNETEKIVRIIGLK